MNQNIVPYHLYLIFKATQCVPGPIESSKFIMYIPSSFGIISLDVTCICIFNFLLIYINQMLIEVYLQKSTQ